MKLSYLLAPILAVLIAVPALAQSTSTPVTPGSLVTTGCPPGYTVCFKPYSSTNPPPGPSSATSTFATDQGAVATPGTAVQLHAHAGLINGIIVTACPTNTANILVGASSSVSTAADGTGNGDLIQPGASKAYGVSNSNAVWINSTAAGCVTFAGN